MATRSVSNGEFNKIRKEIHNYKRTTDKEIKRLNEKIARLQKAIEKNSIQEDSPDKYEIKAIKDFESKRKKGQTKFVSLDSLS